MRFRVCGEGGRLESPTGFDLTVFSVIWNATFRKLLHEIGTICLAVCTICSLVCLCFLLVQKFLCHSHP